jgi:hypothetical protein
MSLSALDEPRDAGLLNLVELEESLLFQGDNDLPFDISAECFSTCNSGFTLRCDGQTIGENCKSTCVTGATLRCDGHTLR